MENGRTTFSRMLEENPCDGCPAPCCRMLLFPWHVPETFIDLDFIRYSLMFPGTEFVVRSDGTWSTLRWQACQSLDGGTCRCMLHGTPQKPRICTQFSPHGCWYKANFVTATPPDLYRLDLARFTVWVEEIELDDAGRIVAVPSFERSQELLHQLPIEPTLEMDPRLAK